MIKRTLLSALGLLALGTAAVAQVNVVPQVGTISAVLKDYTYSAISRGLVPAASATDIFCIAGSSTRAISIKKVRISGTAGTLVTAPFTIVRRASLDTGGTPATTSALPVGAPNLSTDPASSATLVAYTANPTIVDASPTYYRSQWITLPTTAAGTSITPGIWEFGEAVSWFSRGLDIPKGSTAQQYCINLNAVSITSGLVDIEMTWTEK